MKIANLKEKLLLISVSFVWGCSYPLSKMAFDYMGTLTMISLRFLIGSIVVAIYFHKKMKFVSKSTLKNGILLGLLLFSAIIFATYGVEYTTASNAGFLSCLYIIFIPSISFFLYKKKLNKKEIIGSLVALVGIFLLTITENLSIHYGDFLCIIASIIFAFMIIFSDMFAKKDDAIILGIIELAVVGILSTVFAVIFESYKVNLDLRGFLVISSLALLCTAYCYVMLIHTQKVVNPVETGLILSFEPLFSALLSFFFLGEILLFRAYIGAVLIMFGIIFGGVL